MTFYLIYTPVAAENSQSKEIQMTIGENSRIKKDIKESFCVHDGQTVRKQKEETAVDEQNKFSYFQIMRALLVPMLSV